MKVILFCYLNKSHCSISTDRLTALIAHYREKGLTPKEKLNGGRLNNRRAFQLETLQDMVKFNQVHLHCDNCAGQNKNKFMLWYLAWRVASGLHEVITLNFMVKGHTKFLPDSGFGLLKQEFRRSEVSSLECMASVVNR